MGIESMLTAGQFSSTGTSAPSIDATSPDGQGMPSGAPYNSRQNSVTTILDASGTPYKTTARIPRKGDDRSYIDFHNLNTYNKVLHTYQGSNGYADNSYLLFLQREEWYDERRKYSPRSTKIFGSIVDSMVKPVFDKPILRVTSDNLFENFIENCDNCGTPLQNFIKSTQIHARMLGVTFVIMDSHPDASTVTSRGQALEERKFPYIYEKLPQDIPPENGWKTDNWGKLEWITFFDRAEKIFLDDKKLKYKVRQYFLRWDKFTATSYYEEKDPEDVTKVITEVVYEHEHGMGKLPVYPILDYVETKSLKNMPSPVMSDLANMSWLKYNVESWIMRQAVWCFPILTVPNMDTNQAVLSETNAIKIPNDAKFPASFINGSPQCLETLMKVADRIEDQIFKAAGDMGVTGTKATQMISGISKEWDFRAKNSILMETAQSSKTEEKWMAKCFGDYTGTKIDYQLDYPQEFCEAYSANRIETLYQLLQGKVSPPQNVQKEIWIEISKVAWDDDPERAKNIVDGIQKSYVQDLKDQQDQKDKAEQQQNMNKSGVDDTNNQEEENQQKQQIVPKKVNKQVYNSKSLRAK